MAKIDVDAITEALKADDYKRQWEEHLGQYGDVCFVVTEHATSIEILDRDTLEQKLNVTLTDDERLSLYDVRRGRPNWDAIQSIIEHHLSKQPTT